MTTTEPTLCFPTPDSCTNPKHDHLGQVEAIENGTGRIPPCPTCGRDDVGVHGVSEYIEHGCGDRKISNRLICNDCGLPLHYDYGNEAYHHDDPLADSCFLVPTESDVLQILARYDSTMRANRTPDWDTITLVATCDDSYMGARGEVYDTAEDAHGLTSEQLDAIRDDLDAAFATYQQNLRIELGLAKP